MLRTFFLRAMSSVTQLAAFKPKPIVPPKEYTATATIVERGSGARRKVTVQVSQETLDKFSHNPIALVRHLFMDEFLSAGGCVSDVCLEKNTKGKK